MSILDRLSSASGDRTETSNKALAAEALSRPEILDEVAAGLMHADTTLVSNCVEVFTEVAKENPALVAPYTRHFIPLLAHGDTRVRWEATHAVALVASLVPDQVAPLLPDLVRKIEHDRSVIVRDSAVKALGAYGGSSPDAARQAFPLLVHALNAWEGKHAKLVLEGMVKLFAAEPAFAAEVEAAARSCLDHKRANVRQLAARIVQELSTLS